MSELNGVDLSHWNPITSIKKLAAAADFVIHKATEGTGFTDKTYASRIKSLRAAGARVGSYHFALGLDPVAEADHYLAKAGRRPGELMALDVEAEILKRKDLVDWSGKFIDRILEKTAALPVLYISSSVTKRFDWSPIVARGVELWAARYAKSEPETGPWRDWSIWQHTSTGRISGVAGNVDLNRFRGDAAAWGALVDKVPAGAPSIPKPIPKPRPALITSHTVKAGESLSLIARRHGTTWRRLVALNQDRYPSLGANPNLIRVGWTLLVKAGAAPANKSHTVVAGDTLTMIAYRYKTTVTAIVDLNAARYPSLHRDRDLIHPGWTLYVS